jgi:uncharacterized membrane protein
MADNKPPLTLSQKLADAVAMAVGSWRFIIVQSMLLIAWILANIYLPKQFHWDEYPFILLNLFLSFQAAYTAPIIMMSSNRKEDIDRRRSIAIYNLETEDHIILAKMLDHIDKHFENIHGRIDALEASKDL